MKRLHLIGGFAAAATLTLAGASFASAAPQQGKGFGNNIPNGTYNIAFDGYCDGLAITIPGSAGAPGVQAVRTGSCVTPDPLYGATGGTSVGLAYAALTLYWVVNANGTWVIYADCGTGSECVLNSGTWSFGTPQAPAGQRQLATTSQTGRAFGGTQSFMGAGRAPGAKGLSIDISYDGYCDGEHMNIPGAGGFPGVDGTQTGCLANPLIGAKHGNNVGMFDYVEAYYYFNMGNGTWVIFNDCGDGTECYVNSGTWSPGVAAPRQNGTPSTGRR